MTSIEYRADHHWKNFHESIELDVADFGTFRRGARLPAKGPDAFRATGDVLKTHVARALTAATAAGAVGSGWSWSNLIGMPMLQLETDEVDVLAMVEPGDLHPACHLSASHCAYVGGGTKARALVDFAEARDLSIRTCGSYLGQSVAGSIATGVNGSRIGFGGFQNQIRGVHLVTGASQSIWVERASVPMLSEATVARFADRAIRDDAMFEDCLVHLGGMGLVNGVLFELVDNLGFTVLRRKRKIDSSWFDHLADGDFRAIARLIGQDEVPAYYEVQVDPFDPYGVPALHTLYFNTSVSPTSSQKAAPPTVFDGIGALLTAASAADIQIPPDIFEYYAREKFEETPDETQSEPPSHSWGNLHRKAPDEETRTVIYSAALAIDRCDLNAALPAMCLKLHQMLTQLPPDAQYRHMIYTLRFVHDAAGSMAFTRFRDSVVIDLEGIRGSLPSQLAASQSCAALDAIGIAYCQHWGKYTLAGNMYAEREFGPSSDPQSRLARWRATRDTLLAPDVRGVFTNKALRVWGILP